jgi:hypothetical protein
MQLVPFSTADILFTSFFPSLHRLVSLLRKFAEKSAVSNDRDSEEGLPAVVVRALSVIRPKIDSVF